MLACLHDRIPHIRASRCARNLDGNAQRTRHIFNKAFLEALAKDFQEGGPQAIAKVRKQQPAAYMKICALLVPKEFKVERTGGVKDLTDEELDQAIAAVKAMLVARTGETAKVIAGEAEVVPSLPAPGTPTTGNERSACSQTAATYRKRQE